MTSPLLALFLRSLREDARGKTTYWARGGLGVVLFIVVASFWVSNRWIGAPGLAFFSIVISLQLAAITFVGLSYFASAITEEKEDETLGLLRMTDLNPLSILLGKSTSRLCSALFLLVGQIPFTTFAITLGGISLRQIAAVYCTIGAFTFLLCNLALLGSVVARRTGGAAVFCIVALAVFFGAAPLLGWLHDKLASFKGLSMRLDTASEAAWSATPLARLMEVLTTGFTDAPAGWQVGTNLALGAACFLLAWAVFERCCDRAPESATGGSGARPRFFSLRRSRPPRVWKLSLVWKDFYFLCGGWVGFTSRVVCYGGTLGYILWHEGEHNGFGESYMAGNFLSFVFSVDCASMAARMFGTELRDQTFAALAGLPGSIRQIAYRKTLACLLAALPGALAAGVVQILAIRTMAAMYYKTLASVPMLDFLIVQSVASVLTLVLLIHVVARFSLSLKRGALPVGYLVTYAGNALLAMVWGALLTGGIFRVGGGAFSSNFKFGFPIITMTVGITATLILHRQCLRRLQMLAGEG